MCMYRFFAPKNTVKINLLLLFDFKIRAMVWLLQQF
jgi:hypothetical protein